MADLPRLNNVISALESGKQTFTSFCHADPETAIAMATAKYDGIVFEMEHNPWDIRALRDSLQYMLNRGQIAEVWLGRAGCDADGAHSAERRREGAVSCQAGARPRLPTASCGRISRPSRRPITRSPPAAIRG